LNIREIRVFGKAEPVSNICYREDFTLVARGH